MTETSYFASLLGGMAIGLAAAVMMALNGRVAGVSGILSSLWRQAPSMPNVAFLGGLCSAVLIYRAVSGEVPAIHVQASPALMILSGLLVGYGSRRASGCTSGHGVVGLARRSPRSIVAVVVFLASGIATVGVMRMVGLP
ncbi:YeeE/YedE family protein [Hansschlegelia zhihuaiae]|uniref:YeeE/YedE family protein n=1 Tax=Hansschlegelia zhihuaiae TaxID=405005 RepID=A0A4V1KJ74_9HYPH|nr:YeeE/YedE thiosulfate transporter family protein [Hansschlegelia zhihuaiae]RXF73202.1 YeeE/YedE family protein [Hansschlegelia zhihuaiae]